MHPQNVAEVPNAAKFSRPRKWHIVGVGLLSTINSALGSSLPSGAAPFITEHFNVHDNVQIVLLNSLYMAGFAAGPLIFGPMSEHIGRRPVMIGTYIGLLLFTIACALAPTYPALIVFRLMAGINAASPNAVIGGLYSDIYDDPRKRGIAMATFMWITSTMPPLGPVISGFVSTKSWRWTFWVGSIICGAGLPVVVCLPETFQPVLLARQERRQQKELASNRSDEIYYPRDQEESPRFPSRSWSVVFQQPFVMVVQEPILLFSSLYMALVYAILYLYFQAYPIIFQGVYHLSPGMSGLGFLPVMAGATLAMSIFIWYSSYYEKAVKAGKSWTEIEEFRRLPLACISGPLVVSSLFWLGWTSYKSIHPAVPMMAGLFFGTGYLLVFMAMINYLTDIYKQYSASAQAAASTIRSIAAVFLPMATRPMYDRLGIQGGGSLLGGIALLMAGIPFVFIMYRDFIRGRSPFAKRALEEDRRNQAAAQANDEGGEKLADVTVKISI